jgi:hypothetical protein
MQMDTHDNEGNDAHDSEGNDTHDNEGNDTHNKKPAIKIPTCASDALLFLLSQHPAAEEDTEVVQGWVEEEKVMNHRGLQAYGKKNG